jgi:hypothetical protein
LHGRDNKSAQKKGILTGNELNLLEDNGIGGKMMIMPHAVAVPWIFVGSSYKQL